MSTVAVGNASSPGTSRISRISRVMGEVALVMRMSVVAVLVVSWILPWVLPSALQASPLPHASDVTVVHAIVHANGAHASGADTRGVDSVTAVPADSALLQEVRVRVTVSPETVTVGDHFTATVHAHLPADRAAALQFPDAPDSAADVAGLAPMTRRDTPQGGYVDATATYELSAWRTGRVGVSLGALLIGEQPIPLVGDSIVVRSVLPTDSAIRDTVTPKPPRPLVAEPRLLSMLRHPREHTGVLLVVACLLLAASAGLLWWWRTRGGGDAVPAGDWVEREFQRVEAMRLLERGDPELYAILMATVLRQYLIRTVTAVRASATTPEMAAVLHREPLVPAARVLALFERVDLFKFAHAEAQDTAARAIGVECRAIVNEILDRRQAADVAFNAQRQTEVEKPTSDGRREAA